MNNVYLARPTSPSSTSPALVLLLACAAQLMVVLDGLIVSVALPQIRTGLDLAGTDLQWVVTGYLLTAGSLLLLAGRAADVVGHRRVFLAGVALFTVASLGGGLAWTGEVLIAARLLQGAGAAALAPTSLSLITVTFAGEHRIRALSIWSATSASAATLGLVLGGVITDGLGWRWVLLVNVPLGIVLWVVAAASLLPDRPRERYESDWPGALTLAVALAATTAALAGAGAGWGPASALLGLLAAISLALFVVVERRASQPLIPLGILRHRQLVVGNTSIAAVGAVMTATMYFLSLYQQRALGMSPLQTGLALAPTSIVLTAGALASRHLLRRFIATDLVVAGSLVMAAGLWWLGHLSTDSRYLPHLLGATLLWGLGASIVTMPCVVLATAEVGAEHAGVAAGLVNTARQVGGAVGLTALAGMAATIATTSSADTTIDRAVDGYTAAFDATAGAALVIAALVLSIRLVGTSSRTVPAARPRRADHG